MMVRTLKRALLVLLASVSLVGLTACDDRASGPAPKPSEMTPEKKMPESNEPAKPAAPQPKGQDSKP